MDISPLYHPYDSEKDQGSKVKGILFFLYNENHLLIFPDRKQRN